MPRVCSVCASPNRAAIEAALLEGRPLRTIATTFAVSRNGVALHRDEHLPEKIAEGHRAQEAARADDLWARVEALEAYVLGILAAAATGSHAPIEGPFAPLQIPSTVGGVVLPVTALQAAREYRGVLELIAKVQGALPDDDDDRHSVTIVFDEGWRTGQ